MKFRICSDVNDEIKLPVAHLIPSSTQVPCLTVAAYSITRPADKTGAASGRAPKGRVAGAALEDDDSGEKEPRPTGGGELLRRGGC